jgi:hypothetical protein
MPSLSRLQQFTDRRRSGCGQLHGPSGHFEFLAAVPADNQNLGVLRRHGHGADDGLDGVAR